MRRSALFCLAFLAAAGAHAADTTQVFVDRNELVYFGELDQQANTRLFALYDSLKDKPATLSIRSVGGPTGAGLQLGQWVRDRKLDVKVMEYCMSSCANYVFPAGIHKVVSNFAVIGLHGGLNSTSFSLNLDPDTQKMLDTLTPEQRKAWMDKTMKELMASIKPDADKEQAYLKALGVRADYVTLGQQDRYKRLMDDPKTLGWTYSLEDFGRLGIRDITVINPPWRPGSALKNVSFPVLTLPD